MVTQVGYDPENGTFVLVKPELVELQASGVPDKYVDRVKDLTNKVVAEKLSVIPFYKLRAKDVKTAVARLLLKEVRVQDGVLYVTLGL